MDIIGPPPRNGKAISRRCGRGGVRPVLGWIFSSACWPRRGGGGAGRRPPGRKAAGRTTPWGKTHPRKRRTPGRGLERREAPWTGHCASESVVAQRLADAGLTGGVERAHRQPQLAGVAVEQL